MDKLGDNLADNLLLKIKEVYEDDDGTTFTFEEVLAEAILQLIYRGINSPYSQLLLIERYIEVYANEHGVSYASLARALRKEAKKWKKCIACKKKVAKPCFTLNMDDISYLRKRKHQTGTGKGDLHLNKHSPKMKQIEAIINSYEEYKLNPIFKDNIRTNLKDLRPELLTLIASKVLGNTGKTDIPLPVKLYLGLIPILPEREKDFFFDSKIPKYGKEIDVKEYLTFWNYASQLNYLGAMKGEGERVPPNDDIRHHIETMLGIEIPFACEKDTEWWKEKTRQRH
jgi:hypothetical protein